MDSINNRRREKTQVTPLGSSRKSEEGERKESCAHPQRAPVVLYLKRIQMEKKREIE